MSGQLISLFLAFAAGVGLGGFYFGTLWLVVRRLPQACHPGLLLALSTSLRTAAVLVAFYFVMGGDWRRLLACFAGFIGARTLMVRRARSRRPAERSSAP